MECLSFESTPPQENLRAFCKTVESTSHFRIACLNLVPKAAAATEWARMKAQEKRPRDWKGPKNGLRLWIALKERMRGWEEVEETHGLEFQSKQVKNPSEKKLAEMQTGLMTGFEGMMGDTFKAMGGGLPSLLAEEGIVKGSGLQTFEAADPGEPGSHGFATSDAEMPLVSSLLDSESFVPFAPRPSESSFSKPNATSSPKTKKRVAEWPAATGAGDSVDSKGSGGSRGEIEKSEKKRAKQQNQLPVHRLTAVGAWRSSTSNLMTSLKGGLEKSVTAKDEIDDVVSSTIQVRKKVEDPNGMGSKEQEVLNEYLKVLESVQKVVMATLGEAGKPESQQAAELSKVIAKVKVAGCHVCDEVDRLQCISQLEAVGIQRLDLAKDIDSLAEAKEPQYGESRA